VTIDPRQQAAPRRIRELSVPHPRISAWSTVATAPRLRRVPRPASMICPHPLAAEERSRALDRIKPYQRFVLPSAAPVRDSRRRRRASSRCACWATADSCPSEPRLRRSRASARPARFRPRGYVPGARCRQVGNAGRALDAGDGHGWHAALDGL